jgi:hypothetical protein
MNYNIEPIDPLINPEKEEQKQDIKDKQKHLIINNIICNITRLEELIKKFDYLSRKNNLS